MAVQFILHRQAGVSRNHLNLCQAIFQVGEIPAIVRDSSDFRIDLVKANVVSRFSVDRQSSYAQPNHSYAKVLRHCPDRRAFLKVDQGQSRTASEAVVASRQTTLRLCPELVPVCDS